MWRSRHIFTLALAEMLVILATLSWPPHAQALSIFATFFLFVSLYLIEDEDDKE